MNEQLFDSLLAQIEAAPDSLPLRQVLADALSEAGDPRGELIALQLKQRSNPQSAAQTQVLWQYQLSQHRQALCGTLSADDQVSWRLGYWDELHLHGPNEVLDHTARNHAHCQTPVGRGHEGFGAAEAGQSSRDDWSARQGPGAVFVGLGVELTCPERRNHRSFPRGEVRLQQGSCSWLLDSWTCFEPVPRARYPCVSRLHHRQWHPPSHPQSP